MLTLLNELRSIDLDHPDTQKAMEELKVIFNIFKLTEPPNPHTPSDR